VRYERVREVGVIASQAGFGGDRVLGGLAPGARRLSGQPGERSSWPEFVTGLRDRGGLVGVEFIVSDDHPRIRAAIREVLPETVWQRCYVHFLRKALAYVPRKRVRRSTKHRAARRTHPRHRQALFAELDAHD
jgi:putative transposase